MDAADQSIVYTNDIMIEQLLNASAFPVMNST